MPNKNIEINGRQVKPIEESILEKLYESISRETVSREGEIHVSSLCYPCIRKSYYTIKHGRDFYNLKTLITFWIGRQLHKTQILSGSELPLKWNGIIGSADEFENGILLEKKTCTRIPQYPLSHHVRQAEYYSVMLAHDSKPVKKAFIVYIDIANKDIKVVPVKMRPQHLIEKEMLFKKNTLELALEKDHPPPRSTGWLCSWCNFSSICFNERGKP